MRYVLFCHNETPDPADLRKIADAPGVKIIDHAVPRVLLVEASEEAAARLRSDLKEWTVGKKVTYPSPRVKFRKGRPEK